MKRISVKVFSVILSGMISACGSSSTKAQEPVAGLSEADSAISAVSETPAQKSISMVFTGDVMMGTNFPNASTCTSDGGKNLFKDCKDIMRNADLCIINLEGACYDGPDSDCTKKYSPTSTTCYIFRMPADHVQNLVDAGVDAVNFANNHSNDFGLNGRKGTIKNMRDNGIEIVGIKGLCEGAVLERAGLKIAFVTFAASCTGTNDLNNYDEVKSLVKAYRDSCDLLVVGFHGGAEGSKYMNVPKARETFLGENRGNVMEFAHLCIDNGADIVVGHGPHVSRAIENYNGHLIAYSLGNFAAPYMVNLAGPGGHAPLLEVSLNADGSFASGKIHSYQETRGIGPRNDPNKAALQDIKRMTLTDFPNTKLEITSDGEILFK
ncbi:MAG: CapA family protein [Bacteroidales bacterium]|nr:CapA family protein [Bacteroidales bacterium]